MVNYQLGSFIGLGHTLAADLFGKPIHLIFINLSTLQNLDPWSEVRPGTIMFLSSLRGFECP